MRARFLQDLKQADVVKVGYVPTMENAADLLTKPLERSKFIKHRAYLMGDADPELYARQTRVPVGEIGSMALTGDIAGDAAGDEGEKV